MVSDIAVSKGCEVLDWSHGAELVRPDDGGEADKICFALAQPVRRRAWPLPQHPAWRAQGSEERLRPFRKPGPGLYASGNAAAATEQGIGYQAGLSLASAMTFSYLAVRHMLGAVDPLQRLVPKFSTQAST